MIAVRVLISLLVPIVIGFAFVRVCIPGEKYFCRHDWLKLFLGIGIGFGICSCALFVWLLTYGTVHVLFIAFEISLAVILGALARFRATGCGLCKLPQVPRGTLTGWRHPLIIAFGLLSVGGCISFGLESRIHPEGQGDAWSIWNLRARSLSRGGTQWRTAFSGTVTLSMPDYPLLLPGLIARSWIYTGVETQAVPVGIAALFTIASVGLLTTGLSQPGEGEKALLAGIVLLGTDSFIKLGAAQYADVPLAFYFLASIVLIYRRDRSTVLADFLIGISLGLAAWTKNEGLLFCALTVFALKWTGQPLRRVLAGACWILALVVIFKVSLVPANYLAQSGASTLFGYITDPSRYMLIAAGLIYHLIHFGGLGLNPLIPVASGLFILKNTMRRPARTARIALVGMCAGIAAVYLITPQDEAWQIAWSLGRLLLQLWPAVLFVLFDLLEFAVGPDSHPFLRMGGRSPRSLSIYSQLGKTGRLQIGLRQPDSPTFKMLN